MSALSALLMLFCISTQGQRYAGYFNQAEKLFSSQNYYEASQVYEKYLATERNSRPRSQPFAVEKKVKGKANMDPHEEAVYHLAESYRMINNYQKAEKYYKEATGFSSRAYPASRYWYAVTLRANGKYTEAIQEISLFLEKHTQLDEMLIGADRELENLRFIQTQSENISSRFMLTAYTDPKNKSAYALTLKGPDQVAFTAVKEESGKNGQMQYANVLVESKPEDENPLAGSAKMRMAVQPGENNGMASFSRDGKHLFFTRWTRVNGKTRSAIYESHQTDTGWSGPVKAPSPLNLEGSNSAQPSLAGDGQYLAFSSDRPGGSGGYDLWYASMDSSYDIIQVQNLGNIINTPGDEEAPYFHDKSRTLVFSSNGRIGMGGFDLYYARGNFNLSAWEKPENAGAPLNSPKDDMYYVSTDDENIWNTGWMSSDRSTECCLALFSVKENNARYVNGTVVDCRTGKPVDHASLTVTDIRHPDRLLGRYSTDSAGKYYFELHNSAHFNISAVKPGYLQKKTDFNLSSVSGKDSLFNGSICMETLIDPAQELNQLLKSLTRSSRVGNFAYKKAVLSDSAHDNLDSLASMMHKYPQLVIQVEGYTDGIGGEAYNIRLAQKRVDACIQYLLKKGVSPNRLVGKAMGKCCPVVPETLNGKDNPSAREINRRVEYKVLQTP
jgi:outer membrane protein OmpA-like peptidoglycan-associated protein/tetratricopeptide (TPR) repeat protein